MLVLAAGAAAAQPFAPLEITGRVLDPRGAGLPAAVELRPLEPAYRQAERQLAGEPRPEPVRRSRADSGGEFLIAAPAAGFWTLVVRHPDYLPARTDLSPLLTGRRLPDLELPRRSELAARMTDGDGRPLAGVTLRVAGWSAEWQAAKEQGWWPETRRARTGDGGLAALPCASGEKVSLAAVSSDRFLYREASCEAGLLELSLDAGLRTVRLLDADGAPAADLYGFLPWPFLAFGASDEDGLVRGPMTPQGELAVRFASAGGFRGEPRWLPPAAAEGGDPSGGMPVLELPPAVAVQGRVVDAFDDTPVSGVWLWLGSGSRHFQTVEDGTFELWIPPRAALHVGGPGYVTVGHRPPAGGGELVVRMAPAMTLRGQVVDSAGAGIAGAVVSGDKVRHLFSVQRQHELEGGGSWQLETIETVTGGDGSFELRRLAPARRFELRAARPGYAARHRAVPPLEPGEPAPELVIVLERAWAGFGQVLNEREMPIGGAEVALLPSLTGAAFEQDFEVKESYVAATDAEGWFALRDLPAGPYYLAARAEGFPELLVPGIEIAPSEEPIDLGTVILVPGVLLSGRVVDAEGQPVAAAQLSVRNADGEQIVVQRPASSWFASAESRQNGSFHLPGLPRDSRLVLLAVADGYLARELAVTTGTDDQRLEVELSRGVGVAGLVLGPQGRPAAGSRVELRATGPQQGLSTATSRTVEAGEGGRFEARGLRPGEYQIAARLGDAESEPLRRRLSVEGPADLTLELRRKASLEVSVVDSTGRPVARAFVRLRPEAVRSPERPLRERSTSRRGVFRSTDGSGVAVFEPLDAGVYRALSDHPELGSAEATVEVGGAGSQRLELRLAASEEGERRLVVSGRVIDPQGLPVSRARVWLDGGRSGGRTTSDDAGAFELRVPAGEYRLGGSHEGFAVYSGEPFALEQDLAGVVVELNRGATVNGRITGLEPEELARVVVLARGPYRQVEGFEIFGQRYGVVDFEGALKIKGLGAGEWQVRAELLNPTRAAAERVEIGRGDGEIRVDLHFAAGRRLTGSVLHRGRPVAGGTVSVRCAGEFQAETFTGAGGRFAVDHVPEARCTVRATELESGLSGRQELEIATDTEVVLEIASGG